MPKFIPRNRVLVACLSALLLLVVLLVGRAFLLRGPDRIGDFAVPVLPGWTQEISNSQWSNRVSYKKEISNNRLRISLTLLQIVPARSVQDMQKVIQNGGHASLPSSRPDMQVQQILEQATSLNGMPAVITKTIYRTSRGTSSGTLIRFVNGSSNYLLNGSVAGASPSPAPEAQAELDQAWKTITEQLRP